MAQVILAKFNFPTGIARLQTSKSGNMDFKEIGIPDQLCEFHIRVSKEPPPTPTSSLPIKGENSVSKSNSDVDEDAKKSVTAAINNNGATAAISTPDLTQVS